MPTTPWEPFLGEWGCSEDQWAGQVAGQDGSAPAGHAGSWLAPRNRQHSARAPDLRAGPGTSLQMQRLLWPLLLQHLLTRSLCGPCGDGHHCRPDPARGAARTSPSPLLCAAAYPWALPFLSRVFPGGDKQQFGCLVFFISSLPPHRTMFAAFSKPGHMLLCRGSSPNVTHHAVQDIYLASAETISPT